ncbi:MAG: hypothetical protein ABSB74_06235 [Tepidisphaeraceae bacterium]
MLRSIRRVSAPYGTRLFRLSSCPPSAHLLHRPPAALARAAGLRPSRQFISGKSDGPAKADRLQRKLSGAPKPVQMAFTDCQPAANVIGGQQQDVSGGGFSGHRVCPLPHQMRNAVWTSRLIV